MNHSVLLRKILIVCPLILFFWSEGFSREKQYVFSIRNGDDIYSVRFACNVERQSSIYLILLEDKDDLIGSVSFNEVTQEFVFAYMGIRYVNHKMGLYIAAEGNVTKIREITNLCVCEIENPIEVRKLVLEFCDQILEDLMDNKGGAASGDLKE